MICGGCMTQPVVRSDGELYCPEYGTKPRGEKLTPPKPESDDRDLERFTLTLYAAYLSLWSQDEVLLDCWNREQKKRAGD